MKPFRELQVSSIKNKSTENKRTVKRSTEKLEAIQTRDIGTQCGFEQSVSYAESSRYSNNFLANTGNLLL